MTSTAICTRKDCKHTAHPERAPKATEHGHGTDKTSGSDVLVASSAKPLIKLAIARTPSNDPEVHAEGCKDIAKGLKSGKYVNDTMHIEVESVEDAARWFWEDFLPGGCAYGESDPDNPMTDDDAQGYTVYLPCAEKLDPRPTPPAKRSAKQDLARRVVEAVANLGLSDDDAKIASQWLHHLPTGTDGSDKRYWPANMPRPNRSDWK
jgi:hypothetical protein